MKTEIILTWDTSTGTSWLKKVVEVEEDNQTSLSRAVHNYFFETKKEALGLQKSWSIHGEDVFVYPVCESANKKLESTANLILNTFSYENS